MTITNFGSLNIDNVYQMERFTAPGETLTCIDLNRYCGGKGLNQSIALSRCGAKVRHAGCIGSDGEVLKDMLEKNNVDCSVLLKIEGETGHTVIQVDKTGQNNIIVYGGSNRKLTESYIDTVMKLTKPGEILLMQNEINLGGCIARKAKQNGLMIAFNPSPVDDYLLSEFPFETVDFFLVNEIEAAALTGFHDPEAAAAELLKRYPEARIVLTLGDKGVLYRDAGSQYNHRSYDVPVVDTTAAGDTFTGFFLGSFASGKSIPECLETGSIAAALAVSAKGAADSIPAIKDVLNKRGKLK